MYYCQSPNIFPDLMSGISMRIITADTNNSNLTTEWNILEFYSLHGWLRHLVRKTEALTISPSSTGPGLRSSSLLWTLEFLWSHRGGCILAKVDSLELGWVSLSLELWQDCQGLLAGGGPSDQRKELQRIWRQYDSIFLVTLIPSSLCVEMKAFLCGI